MRLCGCRGVPATTLLHALLSLDSGTKEGPAMWCMQADAGSAHPLFVSQRRTAAV